METRRYRSFDCLKGIACIAVVLIHIPFPGILQKILGFFNIVAVPVFFLISGYLCYDDNRKIASCKIKKQIKKITCMLGAMLLIYGLFTISLAIVQGRLNEWITEYINLKTLRNMILFNDYDIICGGQFWFFPVLIECYLLQYFINEKNQYNVLYKLIPLLLVAHCVFVYIADNHLQWINGKIGSIFIFKGYPYFIVGNYLAFMDSERMEKLRNNKMFDYLLLGIYIVSVLIYYFGRGNISSLLYMPMSCLGIICLFVLACKNPNKSIGKLLEILGKKYSMYIYLFISCHSFSNG